MYRTVFVLCCLSSISIGESVEFGNEIFEDPHASQTHVIGNFIDHYYKSQRTVKVFQSGNYSSEWLLKVIFDQRNVLTYRDGEKLQKQPVFKQNFGYLKINDVFNKDSLSFMGKMNASGPWLVHVNGSFTVDLLKEAWDTYKLLHLIVLTFEEALNCFCATYYNPFTNALYKDALVDVHSIQRTIQTINGRVRDMKGYKLKIFLLDTMETYAHPVYDKNGVILRYEGIDGEILEGLRHSMKFNLNSLQLFQNNTTFTELLSHLDELIFERQIDLLALRMTVNFSRLSNVYPLNYISPTMAVCVVRANRVTYLIEFLFGFADVLTTVLLYVSVPSLVVAFFLIVKCLKRPQLKADFTNHYLDIVGVLYSISRPIQNFTPVSLRMIIACAFCLNIFVASMFQASIFKDLNYLSKNTQINTIEELVRENITIQGYGEFYEVIQAIKNDTNAYNELKKQVILQDDVLEEDILRDIATDENQRHTGVILFKYQALLLRAPYLDRETGTNRLHIVKEPILSMIMAFQVPPYSPFLEVMDEMSIRALETGFYQKGENDATFKTILGRIQIIKKIQSEGGLTWIKPRPIVYENCSYIVWLYFAGIGVAFVTFILEVICFRLKFVIVKLYTKLKNFLFKHVIFL